MLTKILQKEKLRDKQGNLITDPMELTQLQEITLAKKYPKEFYKYWMKQKFVMLPEYFGEYLVAYPKGWNIVKKDKISLGVGSWCTIFSSLSSEELDKYASFIDFIPEDYIEELLLADGANAAKITGTGNISDVVANKIYDNPCVDLKYVLDNCRKNVEELYVLLFYFQPRCDFIFSLVYNDPKYIDIIEEYEDYEFTVAEALKILRKHPNLVDRSAMPIDDFNNEQWESLIKLHPKNKKLVKVRKEIQYG